MIVQNWKRVRSNLVIISTMRDARNRGPVRSSTAPLYAEAYSHAPLAHVYEVMCASEGNDYNNRFFWMPLILRLCSCACVVGELQNIYQSLRPDFDMQLGLRSAFRRTSEKMSDPKKKTEWEKEACAEEMKCFHFRLTRP